MTENSFFIFLFQGKYPLPSVEAISVNPPTVENVKKGTEKTPASLLPLSLESLKLSGSKKSDSSKSDNQSKIQETTMASRFTVRSDMTQVRFEDKLIFNISIYIFSLLTKIYFSENLMTTKTKSIQARSNSRMSSTLIQSRLGRKNSISQGSFAQVGSKIK